MHRIIDEIEREKEILAQGEFFRWLAEPTATDQQKLAFIPGMFAYVLSFRDLLSLITDPPDGDLQDAVNAYVAEDAGHFQWYLDDLKKLDLDPVEPADPWDHRLLPSRRAIYRMIAYALDHDDVMLRVALVMIFEATGEVFLRHTRQLVQRLGLDESLGYFGTLHYHDELAHSIQFDQLRPRQLTDEQYAIASEMVRKAFVEYQGLFQSWKDRALAGRGVALYDGRELRAG